MRLPAEVQWLPLRNSVIHVASISLASIGCLPCLNSHRESRQKSGLFTIIIIGTVLSRDSLTRLSFNTSGTTSNDVVISVAPPRAEITNRIIFPQRLHRLNNQLDSPYYINRWHRRIRRDSQNISCR